MMMMMIVRGVSSNILSILYIDEDRLTIDTSQYDAALTHTV